MKSVPIVSLFVMVAVPSILGQSQTRATKPPKEVVEQFWKFETEGGRLTPEGWRKAAIFFLHPNPILQKKTIAVISRKYEYSVDERWINGNEAEIANGCFDLGRIDDSLHYTPPDPRYHKTAVLYHLVLTDKHWEIGPDGVTEKEITGPPAWRIKNPEPVLWLTVDTAIRYISEMRDKTKDSTIRKNAEQTLTKLKNLH